MAYIVHTIVRYANTFTVGKLGNVHLCTPYILAISVIYEARFSLKAIFNMCKMPPLFYDTPLVSCAFTLFSYFIIALSSL